MSNCNQLKLPMDTLLLYPLTDFWGMTSIWIQALAKCTNLTIEKHTFSEDAAESKQISSDVNSCRTSIEKALVEYLSAQYKKDKATVTVYGSEDGTITVCLSARNVHLPAFWSGGWRSILSFNCKQKGASDAKCSTKVSVHYFEDGNVQLHAAIEKNIKITVADDATTGANLVKALQKN